MNEAAAAQPARRQAAAQEPTALIDQVTSAKGIIELLIAATVFAGMVWGGIKKWPWPMLKRWGARWVAFWFGFDTIVKIPQALADLQTCVSALQESGEAQGRQVEAQGKEIGNIARTMVLSDMALKATLAANPYAAQIELNPYGHIIYASPSFTRWTGRRFEDLSGFNWFNVVVWRDRERVRKEVDSAVADCRQSNMRFFMMGADATEFEVDFTITPIPPQGALEKFVGVIQRQDEP